MTPRFAIQTRGLGKVYGRGEAQVMALHGVDLDIAVGEFTSIMGPSGSGKSTLLQLIGLLDAPTSGAVRVMEQDASHLDAKRRTLARREHLGFVFQAFHLLPRATALQNVMLPLALAGAPRRSRAARARAALEAVGLGDRMHHRPNQLSGGQKQRVAIARALALDPPIILADEPTGNLDSATSHQIMRLFQRLNRAGKTIVQVTHAPDMARYGRRVVHVRDGRLERHDVAPPGRRVSSASATAHKTPRAREDGAAPQGPGRTAGDRPTTSRPATPRPEARPASRPEPPGRGATEPRPNGRRPSEPRPSEQRPSEPRPSERRPSEPRPSEPRPSERRPSKPGPSEQRRSEPSPSRPGAAEWRP